MKNLILMLLACFLGTASFAQLNCSNVTASISASVSGGTVTLTNNSTPTATSNIFTSYYINWGDNSSTYANSNATQVHTYNTSGTYAIQLISQVQDSINNITCTDTANTTVNITTSLNCNNVNAQFYTYRVGNTSIVLVNQSTPVATNNLSVQYHIDWGDNSNTTTSSVANQTHNYNSGGNYTVKLYLTVIDSNSNTTCHDTATNNVSIPTSGLNCNNVKAQFFTNTNLGNVNLNNFSTPNITSAISASFNINWGDGNTTTATNKSTQSHTYTASGGYTITMIATYTDGTNTCVDTAQDTVSINLTIPNVITGTIYTDSNNTNISDTFKVWLITFDSSTNILAAVDSQIVSGFVYTPFIFNNKSSGAYRVKAQHLNGPSSGQGYVPTYHDSALLWSNATVFTHTGTVTAGKNIYMKKGAIISGNGFIGGNVNQGANKGTANGIPGMTILLLDANGKQLDYTITDANGHYSFSNLPAITYQVHPENIGYTTTAATIVVDGNNTTHNSINFERSHSQQTIVPKTTGIENINNNLAYTVYPNPAQDVVYINWGTASEDVVNITITDISGKKVLNTEKLMNGNSTIDIHNLHAGLYFLTVTAENGNTTQKLIIE